MKSLKILAIAFAFLILQSCHDDDSNPTENPQGEWTITRVSGGFAGGEQVFSENTIIWEFKPKTHQLVVTNTNTDPNIVDGLDSGTYTYKITGANNQQACAKTIVINNEFYGCITVEEFKITIDDSFADGFKYEFNRKNQMVIQ